jgi:hypothetical protein
MTVRIVKCLPRKWFESTDGSLEQLYGSDWGKSLAGCVAKL